MLLEQIQNNGNMLEEEVVIRHPDAYQLEDIIRNAWSDVKLVAD